MGEGGWGGERVRGVHRGGGVGGREGCVRERESERVRERGTERVSGGSGGGGGGVGGRVGPGFQECVSV